MQMPNMDPRSIKYLDDNGIDNIIHNPRKITKQMLDYFDYFIALDQFILNKLNKSYPSHIRKFFLATAHLDNTHIIDPYKLSDEEYQYTMNNIKITADTIIL